MEENETTKLTKMPATNSGFTLWGLTCFVETFVQGSTLVLKIPHNGKPETVSGKHWTPVRKGIPFMEY